MALACELPGGLFRKCGKSAVGVCKYCGRPYCSGHQTTVITKHTVCGSESCTAKAAFTATATSAKKRAQAHNREGLCGLPSCGTRLPGASCYICGAEYCASHLSARLFRIVEPCAKDADGKQALKKARFFVCDQCLSLVERQGVVRLPVELDV